MLFALEERLLAPANRRASELSHMIRGQSPRTFDVLNRKWLTGEDGVLYHYQFYNPRRQELNGLTVLRFDPADAGRIATRAFATTASPKPGEPDPRLLDRPHRLDAHLRPGDGGHRVRPLRRDHADSSIRPTPSSPRRRRPRR